jgi:hypothetical protein
MTDDTTVAQGPDVCDICLQPIRRGDLIRTMGSRDQPETYTSVVHEDCITTEETA